METSLTLHRSHKEPGVAGSLEAVIDSLVRYAIWHSEAKHLQIASNGEIVLAEQDVQVVPFGFRLHVDTKSSEGVVTSSRYTLTSSTMPAHEILGTIHKIHREADGTLHGTHLWFLQPINEPIKVPGHRNITVDMALRVANAPCQLKFSRAIFTSNKTFETLSGASVDRISQRIEMFCTHREWYAAKGIPYHLGMLFSSRPGCGKTSAIRAIANHTKRHIINVDFASILTSAQLHTLLFDEELQVQHDGRVVSVRIPIERRLFVIEEIDAADSILLKRSGRQLEEGQLTLRDVLDVLDGSREAPGRMLIFTANDPSKLDDALTRPGRLDIVEVFPAANGAMLQEMYAKFFGRAAPPRLKLPVGAEITPAEVHHAFFSTYPSGDPGAIMQHLAARRRGMDIKLARTYSESDVLATIGSGSV